MTAYIVTVRPNSPERYTDTIWISEPAAQERAAALIAELERRGRGAVKSTATNEGWAVFITECQIEDAALAGKQK